MTTQLRKKLTTPYAPAMGATDSLVINQRNKPNLEYHLVSTKGGLLVMLPLLIYHTYYGITENVMRNYLTILFHHLKALLTYDYSF